MNLYLVDGTYELFRAHFGYPSRKSKDGIEVGATKGYINHLIPLEKNMSIYAFHLIIQLSHSEINYLMDISRVMELIKKY